MRGEGDGLGVPRLADQDRPPTPRPHLHINLWPQLELSVTDLQEGADALAVGLVPGDHQDHRKLVVHECQRPVLQLSGQDTLATVVSVHTVR